MQVHNTDTYTDMSLDGKDQEIIKPLVEDRIFYGLTKGTKKRVEIFVQEGEVHTKTMNPFDNEDPMKTFKIGLRREYNTVDREGKKGEVFGAYIRHDNFKLYIRKNLYSPLTLLAELAAFFQTGRLVLMGLSVLFRRADFMNTIL